MDDKKLCRHLAITKEEAGMILHRTRSQGKTSFMALGLGDNLLAHGKNKEEVSIIVHRMHSQEKVYFIAFGEGDICHGRKK